jgi:L-amino acid N-acyltransferase YncA
MLLMKIEKLNESHYLSVKEIYLEGIATGHATFQTDAPAWNEWDKSHLIHSRIVVADGNNIAGWAALTPVSGRCVYAGVAEVSVYVAAVCRGKGVGDLLLKELIKESEANAIWTLQAGIFPENEASLNLHEKNGFRIVGTREKVGKMNSVWRDTVLLERRSKIIGTD